MNRKTSFISGTNFILHKNTGNFMFHNKCTSLRVAGALPVGGRSLNELLGNLYPSPSRRKFRPKANFPTPDFAE